MQSTSSCACLPFTQRPADVQTNMQGDDESDNEDGDSRPRQPTISTNMNTHLQFVTVLLQKELRYQYYKGPGPHTSSYTS